MPKNDHPNLIKNSFGYYELKNKPTSAQLEEFYRSKYFDSKNFEIRYSKDEYEHKFLNAAEAYFCIGKKNIKVLDIGCGEGFTLDFFNRMGEEVVGIDYTLDGVMRHFPNLTKYVKTGDLEIIINQMINEGSRYDLITADNVLEHVLDPISLIKNIRLLLNNGGAFRVMVPNDNSYLQKRAVDRMLSPEFFWYQAKEHMSYFNGDSLKNIFKSFNFKEVEILGDFPIDFFIFNEQTNFTKNPDVGHKCHKARILIDNLLNEQGTCKLVHFRRGLGMAGLGRNVICYAWK